MMQVLQRLQEDWAIKVAISCIVSITVQEHAQISEVEFASAAGCWKR